MGDSEPSYQLRAELIGHEEDVRVVIVIGEDIVTGSRDKTIRIWKQSDEGFEEDTILLGHQNYVSALREVPAGKLDQCPDVTLVSGSRDASVILWNVNNATAIKTLTGHSAQVSSVAVGGNKDIISSSHDGTVRVYSGSSLEDVKSWRGGGDGPVQSVLVLDSGDLVTGSNDTTIKMYKAGQLTRTVRGHGDTVRALAAVPGIGFVSASHDFTVKLWDLEGNNLGTFRGHTQIVYCVASSSSGLIASGSEDNTVKIWRRSGECIGTLPHPGCVWDVAFLPNGDLVTACSDSIARVWTIDHSRVAPQELQEIFQQRISARAESGSGAVGGTSTPQLPAGLVLKEKEDLQFPGNKDGEIMVVNENGVGMAYSWSQAEQTWVSVGQVTGGSDASQGTSYLNGQSYDHVINVDVDDNREPLKLGVNNDDNPYEVADRFMEQHGLPTTYREQIVQFITQNTGVREPMDLSMNFDPFTGGGAYVPTPSTSDPYRSAQGSRGVTGGGVDPFTGSQRRPAQSSGRHIPASTMIIFDNALNVAAVGKKIRDLNAGLVGTSSAAHALTEQDSTPGGVLDRLLNSASSTPRSSATRKADEMNLLGTLLRWPTDSLFPAFDIARLAILQEDNANGLASFAGPISTANPGTLGAAIATALKTKKGEAVNVNNQQTVIRFLCNCFRSSTLLGWMLSDLQAIFNVVGQQTALPKSVRPTAAAFLLNVVIHAKYRGLELAMMSNLSTLSVKLLQSLEPTDEVAIYRSLLALGTLGSVDSGRQLLNMDSSLRGTLNSLSGSKVQRLQEAAQEVLQTLT